MINGLSRFEFFISCGSMYKYVVFIYIKVFVVMLEYWIEVGFGDVLGVEIGDFF